MYSKTVYAGWAEMDFNAHMANTAYLNKAVDVRLMFFPNAVFRRASSHGSISAP